MKLLPLSPLLRAAFLLALLHSPACGQEPNDKARRYYESLLKRPAPGAVFERFYNAWLDSHTLEEMEQFLTARADAPDAPDAVPAARVLLALYYTRQNESAKALAAWQKVVESNPGDAGLWLMKAREEARVLDYDAALASLEKASAAAPAQPVANEIRQLQGRMLMRSGRGEEAAAVWQALIAAQPDQEDLREDLLELQLTEGLTDQALATAQALLERTTDPYRKALRRVQLGEIHLRAGKREEAAGVWVAVLEETGSGSWLEKDILARLEAAYRKDDALEALMTQYKVLAERYPQRVFIQRQYAGLLASTGRMEEALEVYRKVLVVTPGDRALREGYVDLLIEAKRMKEAASQMQELIRLHPDDLELTVKLADLYARAELPDDCRQAVEEYLRRSDQGESAWLRAAGLLERYKLPAAAEEMYNKTAEKFPASETAADARATALHKAGRKADAVAAWQKLAQGADKARLMSVARSASARDEHALAWELLTARVEEFSRDVLYLGQLCELAPRLDKEAAALPWARTLLNLAADPAALETQMTLYLRLLEKADGVDALREELKIAAATATVQERCLLAELLDRHADPAGAEALLKSVSKEAPELATAVIVRLQTQRGDTSGAADSMKQLVEGPGGRKSVHVQRLVELYDRAGKWKEALQWLPEWKKLAPGSLLPWQKEAALYQSLGRTAEALKTLRQAAGEFDSNEDVKVLLADACAQDGKHAEAMQLYTALYESAADLSTRIRYAGALADVAKNAGKIQELLEAFEVRRRENRTSQVPLLALAEIYRVMDDYEKRRSMMEEAARLKEGDVDFLLEIARVAEAQEDWPRAILLLRQAEPLDKAGRVRPRLARALLESGDEEKGMEVLRNIAAEDADQGSAEDTADAMASRLQWKQCVEFLEPVVARFPDDYRLRLYLGVACEESSDVAAAAGHFRAVLDMTKEMPPRTGTPGASGRNYWTELLTIMPPDSVRLMRMMNFASSSYQYRRNAQSGSNTRGVSIPPELANVQFQAIAHLVTLAQDMGEAERTAVETLISRHCGCPAGLVEGLVDRTMEGNATDFPALLEKYPDNESLLALSVWYRTGAASDTTFKAWQTFRTNYPAFARLAALGLADSDVEAERQAFVEAATVLAGQESLQMIELEKVTAALSSDPEDGTVDSVEPAARQEAVETAVNALRAKLPGWYRKTDPSYMQTPWVYYKLVAQLSRSADPAPLVRMLEEEIAGMAKAPGTPSPAGASALMNMGSRSQSLISELSFPPASIPGIPPLIAALFEGNPNNYYVSQVRWDPERARAAAALATMPVLKILLLHKAEEIEAVEKEIAALAARAEVGVQELLLAAAWFGANGQPVEAAKLFIRAQQQPLTREQRRQTDAGLLYCATAGSPGDAPDATQPLYQAAREAALRMRRDAVTAAHREELAAAMESLGLEAEAAKLTASTAGAMGAARPGVNYSSGSYNNPGRSGGSRVDALMLAGKREEAVKIAHRELKTHAASWLRQTRNATYQVREWLRIIQRHSLQPDLIAAMTPAEGATVDARVQFAAALDMLGEARPAAEAYAAVLALRPADSDLREALLNAAAAWDPQRAMDYCREWAPRDVLHLRNLPQLMAGQQSHEGRLALMQVLAAALEKADAAALAGLSLDPLVHCLDTLAQIGASFNGTNNLPNLYTEPEDVKKESLTDTPEARAIQQQRVEIHQRVCRGLMQHPSTALQAFARYVAVLTTTGAAQDREEITAQALNALRAVKPGATGPSSSIQMNQYQQEGERQVLFLLPGQWLLADAWAGKDQARLTDVILPDLAKTHPAAAEAIREELTLYFGDPAQFSDLAAATLQRRAKVGGEVSEEWRRVLRIMEQRGLDADFSGPLLQILKTQSGTGQRYSPLLPWCSHLVDRGQMTRAAQLFRSYTEILLGPPERRERLVRSYAGAQYSGNGNARVQEWIQTMREAYASPQLALLAAQTYAVEFSRPGRDSLDQDDFYNYGSALTNSAWHRSTPEQWRNRLQLDGLLGTVDQFVPCASNGNSGRNQNPVERTLHYLANLPEESRKGLEKLLAAEPRTFGTTLFARVLGDAPESSGVALYRHCAEHLESIRKLPPPIQAEWIAMLQSITPGKEFDKETAPGLDLMEWMAQDSSTQQEFLAMQPVRTRQIPDRLFFQKAETAIGVTLAESPERAVELAVHARKYVQAARKLGLSSSQADGDNTSGLGEMLVRAGSAGKESPNFLFLCLATLAHADGFPVEYSRDMHNVLLRRMKDAVSRGNSSARMQALHDKVAALPPGLQRLTLPALCGTLISGSGMEEDNIKALEALISKAPDQATQLLIDCRWILETGVAMRRNQPIPADPRAAQAQKAVLDLLGDASLSLSLRTGLAAGFMQDTTMTPQVEAAAVHLLAETLTAGLPVDSPTATVICRPELLRGTAPLEESVRTDLYVILQKCSAKPSRRGNYGWQGLVNPPEIHDPALALYTKTSDPSLLAMMKRPNRTLLTAAWVPALLRARQFELLSGTIRSDAWAFFKKRDSVAFHYAADLEPLLAEWQATLTDVPEKLLAATIVAALPDDKEAAAQKARSTRLKAAGASLPATLENPAALETVLYQLRTECSDVENYRKLVDAWATRHTLGTTIMESDNSRRLIRGGLYASWLQGKLESPAVDTLAPFLTQFASVLPSEESHYLQESLPKWYPMVWKATPAAWSTANAEQRAALRAAWALLARANDSRQILSRYLEGTGHPWIMALILHAADEELPTLTKQYSLISAGQKTQILNGLQSRSVVPAFRQIGWPDGAPVTLPDLVLRVLCSPLPWPGKPQPGYLRALMESSLLTESKLVEKAPEIFAAQASQVHAILETAAVCAAAGQSAMALASLETAAQNVPAGDHATLLALAMARSSALESLDRSSEAAAALKLSEAVTSSSSIPAENLRLYRERVSYFARMEAFKAEGAAGLLKPLTADFTATPVPPVSWEKLRSTLESIAALVARTAPAESAAWYEAALLIASSPVIRPAEEKPAEEKQANIVRLGQQLAAARKAAGIPSGEAPLLLPDAAWKFKKADLPTGDAWQLPGFDDSTWEAGQLPLGSPDYKTARSQAGTGGVIFARTSFALTDPASVQNFVMKIQRNDGIIVWLNGREMLRSNVPGDKVSADTRATHAVSKAEGETVKESRVTGYRRKALANANILAVALVPHGDGPADAFLNLSIDANVPEEWNVSSTIDRKSLPSRLGAAWEAIPEPARSLLLPE